MDTQKIDLFLTINADKFRESQTFSLYEELQTANDSSWRVMVTGHFKSPVVALLFSLFFGGVGVDRFYLGQIGMGILKLLTLGGLGIWSLIDLFSIMDLARDVNYSKIRKYIN